MNKNLDIKKVHINTKIKNIKTHENFLIFDKKLELLKNRIEYLENEMIEYKKQNKLVNEEITDE